MPTSITSVHSQNKFILQGTADRSPAEDKWRVVKACLAKHKVSLYQSGQLPTFVLKKSV